MSASEFSVDRPLQIDKRPSTACRQFNIRLRTTTMTMIGRMQVSTTTNVGDGLTRTCRKTFLLRPRDRLRSIVMSASVCVSVSLSDRISPEPHARSLRNFLCMLPMSVARSFSGMFTIGRIAYRREWIFFPIDNAL